MPRKDMDDYETGPIRANALFKALKDLSAGKET
jgi:hypothetical protein